MMIFCNFLCFFALEKFSQHFLFFINNIKNTTNKDTRRTNGLKTMFHHLTEGMKRDLFLTKKQSKRCLFSQREMKFSFPHGGGPLEGGSLVSFHIAFIVINCCVGLGATNARKVSVSEHICSVVIRSISFGSLCTLMSFWTYRFDPCTLCQSG